MVTARGWVGMGLLAAGAVSSCSIVSGFDGLTFDLDGEGSLELPNGQPCGDNAECQSGHCADGYCCDSDCGECGTCAEEGSIGTCQAYPVGPDPEGECQGSCDGAGSCARGWYIGSDQYGDDQDQHARAIALADDTVYLTGDFDGTIDFDGQMVTSAGDDVYIAAFNRGADGVRWAQSFDNGTDALDVDAIEVDGEGNILVAFSFDGSFHADGVDVITTDPDSEIVKLDRDGNVVWGVQVGGSGVQRVTALENDSDGNVLAAGYYDTGVTVEGSNPYPAAGAEDVFVMKIDRSGSPLMWLQHFGDSSSQRASAMAVGDGGARIAITGAFQGTMDLGAGSIDGGTATDAGFVAELGELGQGNWSFGFGSGGNQAPALVALGPTGEVAIAGAMRGTASFAQTMLTSNGGDDVLVAVLDPSGLPRLGARWGGAGNESARGMAVDDHGNIVVGGGFSTPFSFGGPDLDNAGGLDVFVAKVAVDGSHLWSQRFGFTEDQQVNALVLEGGAVLIAGDFAGAINFSDNQDDQLVSAGGTDIFLAAFQP